MCGVLAAIKMDKDGQIDYTGLHVLSMDTQARGRDATGFGWRSVNGQMWHIKSKGSATQTCKKFIEVMISKQAQNIIGHFRASTQGSEDNNINNHPHNAGEPTHYKSGFIVHNGVRSNYKELAKKFGIDLETQCDSEIYGKMFEHFASAGGGSLRSAALIKKIADEAGANYDVVLFLHKRQFAYFRSGNPLFSAEKYGYRYFCSRDDAFKLMGYDNIKEIPPGEVGVYVIGDDGVAVFSDTEKVAVTTRSYGGGGWERHNYKGHGGVEDTDWGMGSYHKSPKEVGSKYGHTLWDDKAKEWRRFNLDTKKFEKAPTPPIVEVKHAHILAD